MAFSGNNRSSQDISSLVHCLLPGLLAQLAGNRVSIIFIIIVLSLVNKIFTGNLQRKGYLF